MTYEFLEKIGAGGFGTVDRVKGTDGYAYARKSLVVPPQLTKEVVTPRFEREVKFQSAINHPHVVRIVAHDLAADPPYFIMHIADCSLLDEMLVDRTLGGNPNTALFHILNGLEEIHRLGYLHRDLKPGNVLRFTTGSTTYYALSDFGLMAVGEEASTTLTMSGIGGGTQAYQAPECAINFKRATERSDIYSFGAILHDIFAPITKRLPHDELTAPGAIGPVIEKCTKKNPHRRYLNVGQLREALYAALSNYQFVPGSSEEAKVHGLLNDTSNLPTEAEWDSIFDFLDETGETSQASRDVFNALRLEHIKQLSEEAPDLLAALGRMFAVHCRKLSFNFEYCDVLANKAEQFYALGDMSLKAEMAIAMLVMGLDHNRWFVERVFLRMVNPAISDELAGRISTELSVLHIDFNEQFARMKNSINCNENMLHPVLQNLAFGI